jgi:hypothetical protein
VSVEQLPQAAGREGEDIDSTAMEPARDLTGRVSTAVAVGGSTVIGASTGGVVLMRWSAKRTPGGSLDASNSFALTVEWLIWTVALLILAAIWGVTFVRARRRRTRVVVSTVAVGLVTLGLIGLAGGS